MARWFSRWRRSDRAKASRDPKRRKSSAVRSGPRGTKADRRHQPTPLTWNDPDQDFITRYGDPFDG
jgi:hypothetical protein